ncbi:hypothetical protein EDB84DRAFT_1443543, partial [Lactarius hengduanensis]
MTPGPGIVEIDHLDRQATRWGIAEERSGGTALPRHSYIDIGQQGHITSSHALKAMTENQRVSLAPLGSSDRRKFRARTTERFQLAPEIADALMPDGLLVQRFSAYNGEPDVCTLLWVARTRRGTKRAAVLISQVFYTSGNGDPLWSSVGKAWHPTLLLVLTTPAAVIPVLVGGADLMVPD